MVLSSSQALGNRFVGERSGQTVQAEGPKQEEDHCSRGEHEVGEGCIDCTPFLASSNEDIRYHTHHFQTHEQIEEIGCHADCSNRSILHKQQGRVGGVSRPHFARIDPGGNGNRSGEENHQEGEAIEAIDDADLLGP
ncbi:hypothetical protein SDC9_87509 [bioreactor metagenome]|uniref:Uncharacterized protein n=1 Tax=bioreactor metagenome TaxID=1076179 RepID=A0A644ZM24_9ZZZZ